MGWARGTTAGRGSSALTGGRWPDRSPSWLLGSTSGSKDSMRRRPGAGLAVGLAVVVGGAAILLPRPPCSVRVAVFRQHPRRPQPDPSGDAEPLPGGGDHLPGIVLDDPGRHRDDRVGQRAVEPPGVHSGANRRGRRANAIRATHLCRLRPAGASWRGEPAEPLRPGGRRLCGGPPAVANGAAGGADVSGAVYAYNHSESYVAEVLALAQTYASSPGTGTDTGLSDSAGAVAVSWALSQIGTPYVWGGETPGTGFDCSGLVQAAYAVAGVALPQRGPGPVRRHAEVDTRDGLGAWRPRILRRRTAGH